MFLISLPMTDEATDDVNPNIGLNNFNIDVPNKTGSKTGTGGAIHANDAQFVFTSILDLISFLNLSAISNSSFAFVSKSLIVSTIRFLLIMNP